MAETEYTEFSYLGHSFLVAAESPLTLEQMQNWASHWGLSPDVLPGESDADATERLRKAIFELVKGQSDNALRKARSGWNTDTAEFLKAVEEFEAALPGFWWSVGQCSVGAHASCSVDGRGSQADLLIGVPAGHPLDEGFHCDTDGGSPADALRDVMRQAVAYLETHKAG